MAGDEHPGADGTGTADEDPTPARRRLPVPRGRLQVGSVVSTLVGITGVLSWLGFHPGSVTNNLAAVHPTPTAVETVVSTPPVTAPATDLPVVSLPVVSLPVVTAPVVTAPIAVHPSLRMNPTSGPVGTAVVVTASGFPAGVEVDITLQAYNLATTQSDASGHVAVTVRIPDFFRGFTGRFPMQANQRDSTNYAEEYFTITG